MARSPRRPRTASRVAAVQALFQSEQAQDNPETVIDQFVRHRLGELPGTGGFEDGRVPDADVPLFARIVRAAVTQQDTIDRMLAEALPAGVAAGAASTRCCGRCCAPARPNWRWPTARRPRW